MKKILMGSMVLTALSLSIIAFQVSCSKTANAQTSSGSQQVGIILFTNVLGGGGSTLSNDQYIADTMGVGLEYWTVNYDGTNAKKLSIPFKSGWYYSSYPKLSPDGKTIFFSAYQSYNTTGTSSKKYLLSCSVDGTNLKTVQTQDASDGTWYEIGGAY